MLQKKMPKKILNAVLKKNYISTHKFVKFVNSKSIFYKIALDQFKKFHLNDKNPFGKYYKYYIINIIL